MNRNCSYEGVQDYVREQREEAARHGCKKCGKLVVAPELAGSPSLTRMVRNGYGIERVMEAIERRGWYCRGCAKGITRKQEEAVLMAVTSSSSTIKKREHFPRGPEGDNEFTRHQWRDVKNCPPGYEYDPESEGGEPRLRETDSKRPIV